MTHLYMTQGSYCAGLWIFGSSFKSFWMPVRICFTDMDDFQSSSSFRILRQTVPDGYILGWGITGLNWPIYLLIIKKYLF